LKNGNFLEEKVVIVHTTYILRNSTKRTKNLLSIHILQLNKQSKIGQENSGAQDDVSSQSRPYYRSNEINSKPKQSDDPRTHTDRNDKTCFSSFLFPEAGALTRAVARQARAISIFCFRKNCTYSSSTGSVESIRRRTLVRCRRFTTQKRKLVQPEGPDRSSITVSKMICQLSAIHAIERF
jgi:hypothetical protein